MMNLDKMEIFSFSYYHELGWLLSKTLISQTKNDSMSKDYQVILAAAKFSFFYFVFFLLPTKYPFIPKLLANNAF